jgi:DNA ligase-1
VPFERIDYRDGGLHLKELALWLDPHHPVSGPERVFVSHAHSDHTAPHREVILSGPTARLMQTRLPGRRREHVLAFGQAHRFEGGAQPFEMTLLPAGHIFGSAMAWVSSQGQSLLYTGDFKLRPSRSAEPCEPRPADVLIMETTFGRPQYVFPPTDAVLSGIARFCREALDNDETPVLLGYSLGKSQELLCGLAAAQLPIMLHESVMALTRVYEEFGQCFARYEALQASSAPGHVVIAPPQLANSALLRKLGKTRTAVLTGWALDPHCRYRYRCDAAFPLSDHADFLELIQLVQRVHPKRVLTVHGFAADFAETLRALGYDARALSQDEQLSLPLAGSVSRPRPAGVRPVEPAQPADGLEPADEPAADPAPHLFLSFAQACFRIGGEARKLEKIRLLADYLARVEGPAIAKTTTWFTGRPFPSGQNRVLQLGWAVLRDALCGAAQVSAEDFHQVYLKYSDLGQTAAELLAHQRGPATIPLLAVSDWFDELEAARGPLAKKPILQRALLRCVPLEAKFLVKIITGDLRIGLKEGLVEEAIARAFSQSPEALRQAQLVVGDLGEVAHLAAAGRLGEATLVPFRPVKFMLASPEATAEDLWARACEWHGHPPAPAADASDPGMALIGQSAPDLANAIVSLTVWMEDKYDGVRCQLHKVGQQVALYSRDLKDITGTFEELADAVRQWPQDVILDGEIVAMKDDHILPFAELQRRLGRRQRDLFMHEDVPARLVAFDLLWLAGRSQLDHPLRDRRRQLEALAPLPHCVRLAQITQADTIKAIDAAFAAARRRNNEGLMIKDPNGTYTPGRRGLSWLKLKKAFATLDCVVVGAEYGHGKRSQVLSDYTFAVRDEKTGELKTIGKAYSGLTDAEIAQLTDHFLQTATGRHGRYLEVAPDTVLEIAFDRIQPSTRHSSGLALRFPRILRIRTDKPVAEIDTLESARRLVPVKELTTAS